MHLLGFEGYGDLHVGEIEIASDNVSAIEAISS